MSAAQVTATWTFYMLALLKKHLSLTWDEFDLIQNEYRLVAFLVRQYELLHYYDNDYIIYDAIRYIQEQGGEVGELQRVG
jgi:hypothetical protein